MLLACRRNRPWRRRYLASGRPTATGADPRPLAPGRSAAHRSAPNACLRAFGSHPMPLHVNGCAGLRCLKRVRADPPNQLTPLAGLDDDVVTAGGVVEVDEARDVERCAF